MRRNRLHFLGYTFNLFLRGFSSECTENETKMQKWSATTHTHIDPQVSFFGRKSKTKNEKLIGKRNLNISQK